MENDHENGKTRSGSKCPNGTLHKHCRYVLDDSFEEAACRLETVVRHLYYISMDAEKNGYTDHETLTDFTNSLLYIALDFERRIKETYEHKPTKRRPIHGKERKLTENLRNGLRTQYENLRRMCNERIDKK